MLTCARCEPKERKEAMAWFMRWLGYAVAFLVGLVAWGLFYLWELSR